MEAIRVVLADDHTLFREGTRELLEREPDIEVVAEAATGDDAVSAVDEVRPEVAIIDLEMPGMNGIEATKAIKAAHPEVGVLVLTVHDEEPYVFAILEAGAAGYLLKDVHASEVVQAVRALRDGESVLHPAIARQVLSRVRGEGGRSPGATLTAQQREVLALAAGGHTNAEIGAQLGIGTRTVQLRLTGIFELYGVSSRTEAVIRALRDGSLDLAELS